VRSGSEFWIRRQDKVNTILILNFPDHHHHVRHVFESASAAHDALANDASRAMTYGFRLTGRRGLRPLSDDRSVRAQCFSDAAFCIGKVAERRCRADRRLSG
jgi:hypothetical protein